MSRPNDEFITSQEMIRFRQFSPIDRESPIIEILYQETVIADVARSIGDDVMSEFEIAFHEGIAGLRVSMSSWITMIRSAEDLVRAEEAS